MVRGTNKCKQTNVINSALGTLPICVSTLPRRTIGRTLQTRVMRKRKATDLGLRGIEAVDALHTLTDLGDVLLREQRQEEEAETRGGEGTGSGEEGTGEGDERPTTESVLEKLGDLISELEAKVEGPHVSNLQPSSRCLIPHDSPFSSLMSPSKF